MDHGDWTEERHLVRAELKSLLKHVLPPEVRKDAWTPKEVLHHILVANRGSLHLLERLYSRGSDFSARVSGSWPVREELLDFSEQRAFSVGAFPGTEPDRTVTNDVMQEMEALEDEKFQTLGTAADSLELQRLGFRHPLAGTLNFYEWLCFCTVHERLHLARLKKDLGI